MRMSSQKVILHVNQSKALFTLQATQSHSFQWRAGNTSDSDDWRLDGTCPATQQSSESFKFMQMNSDFREREPIGKKVVEFT